MRSRPPARNGRRCSFGIGIACSNEAQNIGQLLRTLTDSWVDGHGPERLVVVSDGSRDGTDEAVRRFADQSSIPVVLDVRPERRGKAAAVNRIIEMLDDVDVIVLVSADVLPEADCLERMLAPFDERDVGVTACRVVPEGPDRFLAVRVSRLLWSLHHRIALAQPKSTEITAFRNLQQRIDEASLVDEAEIEGGLVAAGYRIVYVPEAMVRSVSPLSIRDYLRQRVRVTRGHLTLAERRGYRVGTLSMKSRLAALLEAGRAGELDASTVIAGAALESAVLAAAHAQRWWAKGPEGRWARIHSAKRPVRPGR